MNASDNEFKTKIESDPGKLDSDATYIHIFNYLDAGLTCQAS